MGDVVLWGCMCPACHGGRYASAVLAEELGYSCLSMGESWC